MDTWFYMFCSIPFMIHFILCEGFFSPIFIDFEQLFEYKKKFTVVTSRLGFFPLFCKLNCLAARYVSELRAHCLYVE